LVSLAAASGVLAGVARLTPWPAPASAGVLAAFVLAAPSYFLLSVTLHRSDAAFFGVFAGGMLARLALLLGAVLVVHRSGVWPPAPFAVAAAGALMILTILELVFLNGQNRLWTSSTPSSTTSSTTSTSA
jgi:hypothetical protein